MINPKDVTIFIPHLGASSEMCYALRECRGSLYATTPEIQTIVIKNGSIKCNCLYDIRINAQGQNKAVNAAIQTVTTPWILVTNDDMIFPLNWWEDLTDNIFMESCISPQLVEPRPGAPTFEVYFCGGAGGDFDRERFDVYIKAQKILPQKGMRNGFNLPFLIRRELWDTIGGYDINYDPWGSNGDSDLEYKIKLAGIQPKQNQNCLVYHFGQTSGTFHPDNQSFWQKNWDYFIQKWGFPRTDDGIWEATFEIPKEGRLYHPKWEGIYNK